MCIQNVVKFCPSILKILRKNEFLTSIIGRYSVANLRKMKIYNTILDLLNDNVYTKFDLNRSIFQSNEQEQGQSEDKFHSQIHNGK